MKRGGGGERRKGKEAKTKEGDRVEQMRKRSYPKVEKNYLFYLFYFPLIPFRYTHSVSRKLVSAFFSFRAFLSVSLIFIFDYMLSCSSFFSFLLFHTNFYFQSSRNSNNDL